MHKSSNFSYDLPDERIAQRPVTPYDSAKLLVWEGSAIHDEVFSDLTKYLRPSDLLLFNNTKVNRARIFGTLSGGGIAELLLLKSLDQYPPTYRAMARPMKRLRIGTRIQVGPDLYAKVIEIPEEREVKVSFEGASEQMIESFAVMPIPLYIRSGKADQQDLEDYQSIFAAEPGSVAAPTASLHFTRELLAKVKALGVSVEELTLHLGSASFLALDRKDKPEPGIEYYRYSRAVFKRIKEHKGRVIAVGTSVVRALESMLINERGVDGEFYPTDLFIKPGYKFNRLDALITNFHQPETTHLLLVEAFIGRRAIEKIYQHALNGSYRFLSYGDGMLLSNLAGNVTN